MKFTNSLAAVLLLACAPVHAADSAPVHDTLGITFTRLTAWWSAEWPADSPMTLNVLRGDLLRALARRSSHVARRGVIEIKGGESPGGAVTYAVDYSEESAAVDEPGPGAARLPGRSEVILCVLRRVDELPIATNWDDLRISVEGFVWGHPNEQRLRRELVFLGNFVPSIPDLMILDRPRRAGKADAAAVTRSEPGGARPSSLAASAGVDELSTLQDLSQFTHYFVARVVDSQSMQPLVAGHAMTLVQPGPIAEAAKPSLLWNLANGDWAHKRQPINEIALAALVRLGTSGIAAIYEMLEAHDPLIRVRAAYAIGALGDRAGVEALIQALAREQPASPYEGKFASRAIMSLGELKDPRAVDSIVAAMKRDSMLWSESAEALGRIGDRRAVGPLLQVLADASRDDQYGVRGNAASALAQIGNPEAVEPLIAALEREASTKYQLAQREISAALRKLTGKDFGADAGAWRSWWKQAGGVQ